MIPAYVNNWHRVGRLPFLAKVKVGNSLKQNIYFCKHQKRRRKNCQKKCSKKFDQRNYLNFNKSKIQSDNWKTEIVTQKMKL